MSHNYADGTWHCRECGKINPRYAVAACQYCGVQRLYDLTYAQAKFIVRKLAEPKNADVRRILGQLARCREDCERYRRVADDYNREWSIMKTENERLHQLQPCGHERRFIVDGPTNFMDENGVTRWGMGWCALCTTGARHGSNHE